jgi:transcriptional regulator with XRE-family HTH domain
MCLDLGMSKSTLSDLKSGRKKSFTADTAHRIASYLGVSVAYLLGEEEKSAKKEQPIEFDGLSDELTELIEHLKTLPEDKIQMLLQVAKSIK